MMKQLATFFLMGGYGKYVFSAYGLVIFALGLQWFLPWQRWRRYCQTQQSHESNP